MNTVIQGIGKKITKTSQDTFDRAKNFAEISRLNLKLANEERQLEELYANLGRMFYKLNKNQPGLLYKDVFRAIEGGVNNVTSIQKNIENIKNQKTFQKSNLPKEEPVETVYKLCTNCGEVGLATDILCINCQKPL